MSRGPAFQPPPGAISLDQLKALKMQQHAQRAQIILNVATQFMCHKVAPDINSCLILADELITRWEGMYGDGPKTETESRIHNPSND